MQKKEMTPLSVDDDINMSVSKMDRLGRKKISKT